MSNRITADEARQMSAAANVTANDVLNQLDSVIRGRTETGSRLVIWGFAAVTLDDQEVAEVLASLRDGAKLGLGRLGVQ